MEKIPKKWICVICGNRFNDEVFAIVTPALYDAELDDASEVGERENYHYHCLEQNR